MMPLLLNKILVPSSHRKPLDPSWFADASGGKRAMFVMAPMVGQSDLPFRLLARKHGATVVFGEMMLADRFAADPGYRLQAFGNAPLRREDHPLVAQFAANTPEAFVGAALEAQKLGCDAVDLNLGCPQRRAKEHHYGSFMTDPCDWALCCAIVHQAAVHPELCLPITVKIRLQPTLEATVQFARLLAASGASMVSVHGRQRGRENQRRDGSANLDWVAAVVRALEPFGVPVVANGNVRCPRDVTANLASTGAAGIMVAEEILRDPAVFSRSRWELTSTGGGVDGAKAATDPCSPPPSGKDLADEYIHLLEGLDRGCFHHPMKRLELETRRLRMEDGSSIGKKGSKSSGRFFAGSSPGAADHNEEGESEFERLSLWWTNAEVLKSHLRMILGVCSEKNDSGLSKKTFKGAITTASVIGCYNEHLSVFPAVSSP